MPQLEEPTTKNTQLCTGGLWGEKGKNKIFKKKKKISAGGAGPVPQRLSSHVPLLNGPGFRQFESWVRTWHRLSSHAEAASHMPQLEGPTTKNTQLCTGGLWEKN